MGDIGLIGYFEGSCPIGWALFSSGQDRFIVGASDSRPAYSIGGKETVTLEEKNNGPHKHFEFSSSQTSSSITNDR